jgi:hypothetical protein
VEFLLIVVIPGLLGGILTAFLLARYRERPGTPHVRPLAAPSPGLINMAHIRIEGIGGLGLVAVSIAVAIQVPRIRMTMAVALALGTVLGTVLIALRRRRGPLATSSQHPGAHSSWWVAGHLR